jgi:hypothetical protein
MAKRINARVVLCFDCPYYVFKENFYMENDDSHYTGWFCTNKGLGSPMLVLNHIGGDNFKNYADLYGKDKVPIFCPLQEDDFEPMFGE